MILTNMYLTPTKQTLSQLCSLISRPDVPSDGVSLVEDTDWTYEVYRAASGFDLYQDAVSWTQSLVELMRFRPVAHYRNYILFHRAMELRSGKVTCSCRV